MSWVQPGHLTQSPSGTRLGFSAVDEAIGFRVFLNQAILGVFSQGKTQKSKLKTRKRPNTAKGQPEFKNENAKSKIADTGPDPGASPSSFERSLELGAWHVVLRPPAHALHLLEQILERGVAPR